MRLTPYRRVVVFHFRYDFQNGFGGKPFALSCHDLNGRFNTVFEHIAGAVSPRDLYRKTETKLKFIKQCILMN